MNDSEVISSLLRMLLAAGVVAGYALAARSLFPNFVDRSNQRWQTPFWDGMLGLLVSSLFVFVGRKLGGVAHLDVTEYLADLMVGMPILLGVIGLAGLASRIGAGLKGAREEARSWRGSLRGGLILGVSIGLPVLGEALVGPVLLVIGVGNAIRSLRKRSKARAERPAWSVKSERSERPERKERPEQKERAERTERPRNPSRGASPRGGGGDADQDSSSRKPRSPRRSRGGRGRDERSGGGNRGERSQSASDPF